MVLTVQELFSLVLKELVIPAGNLCHVVQVEVNLFFLQLLPQGCHVNQAGPIRVLHRTFHEHLKGRLVRSNSITKLRDMSLGLLAVIFIKHMEKSILETEAKQS